MSNNEAMKEVNKRVIKNKRELFIDIANSHSLSFQKSEAQFFQIYPKNIPQEGSGGTHYEFISENGVLYLDIHIESKAKIDRPQFRKTIKETSLKKGYGFHKGAWPVRVDISKMNDDEVREQFNKMYSIFQPVIEQEYNKKETIMSSKANIKNIILYGSPGVGKTHNTNKLISLIERGIDEKEIFEMIKNNEQNNGINISDIKDRVKFITFHQSFGYEDFIEGFRPNEEGNIQLEKGIFLEICNDAQRNFIRSIKYKSTLEQDERQEKLFELFVDSIQDEIDKNGKFYINKTVYITDVEGDAFRYQGINWSNSQRMKFDDIKLLWNFHAFNRKAVKNVPGISGLAKQHATYFTYLVVKLLEFSEKQDIQIQSVRKEEKKNYYLVIDEINRGNISKIFGELITLMEEDKRDTLEVTLPYSKQTFKIPSNLYIIGTMNSTDKSIALIDIALRRRFTFLKMEPKTDLVSHVKAQNIMIQLNEKITNTLGADYVLGHSYFMKIENDDDLAFVLEYKVIPLLEEYYYGDTQGLKNILEIINE